MEWYDWLWVVILGVVVYFFGMNFTYGVKLFPRERNSIGAVIDHPFHQVEAFLWPLAWPAVFLGLTFVLGIKLLDLLLALTQRAGEKIGRVDPPTDPQVQRRLNDIRRPR